MVWYSHLFQNFPQFIVIHTVQGFDVVNKAEIDVFLELSCFFDFDFVCLFVFLSSERNYPTSEVRGGSREELPHSRGPGRRPRVPGCDGAGAAERS